jgi:hypothetical protein
MEEAQLSTYHEAVANHLQNEKRDAAVRDTHIHTQRHVRSG